MTENGSLSAPAESSDVVAGAEAAGDPPEPRFKDRRAGLIAFGTIQLLIALACLALAALQFFVLSNPGQFAPPGGPAASKGTFVVSALMYVVLAGIAVVLGIGSMRCRRWARALNLVLASLGLAMGVMAAVVMALMLPGMITAMESQMGGPQPGFSFVMGCSMVGIALLYLIVPGAFVFFYRSRNVKLTCEHYDPKSRWTDRCPLPVLAGSLLLLVGGSSVLTPLMGFGIPLFGRIITGPGVWLVSVLMGVVSVVLAWGFYRMRRWAWLGALALTVIAGLNVLVSFRADGLLDFYAHMDIPAEQLEHMREIGIIRWMTPMMASSVILVLGFYLFLGRYFKSAEAGS